MEEGDRAAPEFVGASGGAAAILEDFPDLTRDYIRPCLPFAADRERRLASSTCGVKLLLDQNLSPRLASAIADLYADSTHVREVRLARASDDAVRVGLE